MSLGEGIVQTDEQKLKLDEVSELVNQFSEIANNLGQKFKVASPLYQVDGGAFQVARLKGTWELQWLEDDKSQDLRAASMAIKRKFLLIANEFFHRYMSMAEQWEKSIDTDIKQGRKALDEIRKLIA